MLRVGDVSCKREWVVGLISGQSIDNGGGGFQQKRGIINLVLQQGPFVSDFTPEFYSV